MRACVHAPVATLATLSASTPILTGEVGALMLKRERPSGEEFSNLFSKLDDQQLLCLLQVQQQAKVARCLFEFTYAAWLSARTGLWCRRRLHGAATINKVEQQA